MAMQQHYHDSYEWVGSDSDDGGEDGDLVEVRQVVEVLEVVVKVGMEVVGLEVVVWAIEVVEVVVRQIMEVEKVIVRQVVGGMGVSGKVVGAV